MAIRPVFLPVTDGDQLVTERQVEFTWNPGFAIVQKQKNITALHEAAKAQNIHPVLEVSTKSSSELGQRLSAFNLLVDFKHDRPIPLECAFQGSKVFEGGGPYTDLYDTDPRTARRDSRLVDSGALTGFKFYDVEFELEPKTAFYDWLYLRSANQELSSNLGPLFDYGGFTDIEFNPKKSINCQARSCALLVALAQRELLKRCIESPSFFVETLRPDSFRQPHSKKDRQHRLF